ncbi:hypothetical protein ACIQC5_14445 [Paenarthrobacter sp. NPDC092416]|uniref:hypothetical protein n=1 Tax=Paenarthrobacter sp. NPDC092416 TaxID=3364386 RepID=UPI00380197CA
MDLRDAAQELYAAMPREFTAQRTALVRQAKEAGDKELAQQIGSLPKPAAAAWAINMLELHKPEVIDGVVRFGASLRTAQEDSDAESFRELGQQRQGQLSAAVQAAKAMATKLGAPLSAAAATDVEQTLRAAMADSGAASAVATGRLVRGLTGSGFESVDLTGAVAAGDVGDSGVGVGTGSGRQAAAERSAPPARKEPTPPVPREKHPEETAISLADRRAGKRRAALAEALSERETAEKEEREADAAASKAWDAVRELAERRAAVDAEIADAKKQLASLEAEMIGLTRDAESAESHKKQAVRAAAQQRRAADQARRRVERLS